MELARWLDLLKEYGPLVGLFLAMIYWQARRIDKLLDINASIYQDEMDRMARIQDRLLNHALGPQPSSADAPSVEALREATELIGRKGDKKDKKGESDG